MHIVEKWKKEVRLYKYLGTLLHIHIALSIYLHSEEYLLLF